MNFVQPIVIQKRLIYPIMHYTNKALILQLYHLNSIILLL
jgi:hypothetical protein